MHDGHRQRLRERFINSGINGFAQHEILEFLLCYAIPRKDVNPLAHKILDTYGSLADVFNAYKEDLLEIEGVGESAACLITFIGDLFNQLRVPSAKERIPLNTPELASQYAKTLFFAKRTEAFYIILLDNHQRLIRSELISEGSHCETLVDTRKIVHLSLLHSAAYVILTHNHPSGSAKPSASDVQLTQMVEQAFKHIGIICAEHIIIAEDTSYSIKTNRFINSLEKPNISSPNYGDIRDPYEIAKIIKRLSQDDIDVVLEQLDF